jgi:hypothetical protein
MNSSAHDIWRSHARPDMQKLRAQIPSTFDLLCIHTALLPKSIAETSLDTKTVETAKRSAIS